MFVFTVNHITVSTDLFTRIINILLMIRGKVMFLSVFQEAGATWLYRFSSDGLYATTHAYLTAFLCMREFVYDDAFGTMSFCTNWWMIASELIFMGLTVYIAPLDHIYLRENAGSCTYPRISNCVRIWVQLIRFIILRLFWRHLFALRTDNR